MPRHRPQLEMCLYCRKCGDDTVEIGPNPWDRLGEEVRCPICETLYKVEYDESYDSESGAESGWWFLEPMKPEIGANS